MCAERDVFVLQRRVVAFDDADDIHGVLDPDNRRDVDREDLCGIERKRRAGVPAGGARRHLGAVFDLAFEQPVDQPDAGRDLRKPCYRRVQAIDDQLAARRFATGVAFPVVQVVRRGQLHDPDRAELPGIGFGLHEVDVGDHFRKVRRRELVGRARQDDEPFAFDVEALERVELLRRHAPPVAYVDERTGCLAGRRRKEVGAVRETRIAERDHGARRVHGSPPNADVLKVGAVVASRRDAVVAQLRGDVVGRGSKARRQRVTALEGVGCDVFEMVPELLRTDVVDGAKLLGAVGVADDRDEGRRRSSRSGRRPGGAWNHHGTRERAARKPRPGNQCQDGKS